MSARTVKNDDIGGLGRPGPCLYQMSATLQILVRITYNPLATPPDIVTAEIVASNIRMEYTCRLSELSET
jgi:hypothetical protein